MSGTKDGAPQVGMSQRVSTNECQALRHLQAAGWSRGELKMAFEIGTSALSRHLDGQCEHPDVAPPQAEDMPTTLELKQYRYVNELTQREAAEMVGVSTGAWADWESGRKVARPGYRRELRELVDTVEEDIDVPDGWRVESPGRPVEYSRNDLMDAIKRASSASEGRLTRETYERVMDEDMPCFNTFYDHFESWPDAVREAGVEYDG